MPPKRGGGRGRKKSLLASIPPIADVRERCLEGGWAYYLIRRDGEEEPQWSKEHSEQDRQAIRQFEDKQAQEVAQIQLEHSRRIRDSNAAAGMDTTMPHASYSSSSPSSAAAAVAASAATAAASSSAAAAVPVVSAVARPAVASLSLPAEEHKSSHRVPPAVDPLPLQTLRPFRLRDEHKEQIRPVSLAPPQDHPPFDLSDGEVGDIDDESPVPIQSADESFLTASIVVHDPRTLEPHYLPASSAAAAAAASRSAATVAIDVSSDPFFMDDLPALEAAPALSLLPQPILLSQPVLAAASSAASASRAAASSAAASSVAAASVSALSPVAAAVPSNPSACSICCAPDPPGWAVSPLPADGARTLLSCYTCGVTVHAACYGVSVLPLTDSFWWCCVCDPSGLQRHEVPDGLGEKENTGREVERLKAQRAGKKAYDEWCESVNLHQKSCFDAREVKCAICTQRGGAMLPLLQEFNFIHVLCARFLPPSKLEGWPVAPYRWIAVSSAFNCNDVRSAHNPLVRCEACKLERWSYCTHCAVSDCPRRFHVTCARSKGWKLEAELRQSGAAGAQWHFNAFCREHSGLPPEEDEQRLPEAAMADEDADNTPLVKPTPTKRRKQKRRRRPSLLDDDAPLATMQPLASESATEDEEEAKEEEEEAAPSDDAQESSSSDFELSPSQAMRKPRRVKPPKTRVHKRAKTEKPAASVVQADASAADASTDSEVEVDEPAPVVDEAARAKELARNQLHEAFCRPRGFSEENFPGSELCAIPEPPRGRPSFSFQRSLRDARAERADLFHGWCHQAILNEIKRAELSKPRHELLLKQMRAAQTLQERLDIVHGIFGLYSPKAANPDARVTPLSADEIPIFLRLMQLPSTIPADPLTGFERMMSWVSEDPFFKETSNTAQAALYDSMVLQLVVGLDRSLPFWSSRRLTNLSPDELRVHGQLSQSVLFGLDPETFPDVLDKLRERDAKLRRILVHFAFHTNKALVKISNRLVARMHQSSKASAATTDAAPAAAATAASAAAAASSSGNGPAVSSADLLAQERKAQSRATRRAEKSRMRAAAKKVAQQSWDALNSSSHKPRAPAPPPAAAPAAASSSSARPAASAPVPIAAPKRRHAEPPNGKATPAVNPFAVVSALPMNALALAFPQDFSYPVSQATGGANFPPLSRAQELKLTPRPAPTAPASSLRPFQPSSLGAQPLVRSEYIGMGNQRGRGFFTDAVLHPSTPQQQQQMQLLQQLHPELAPHTTPSGRRSPQPMQQAAPMLPSMPRRPPPPPATFGSAMTAPRSNTAAASGTHRSSFAAHASSSAAAYAGRIDPDDLPPLE